MNDFLGSNKFEPSFFPADVITLCKQGVGIQVIGTRKLASIGNNT